MEARLNILIAIYSKNTFYIFYLITVLILLQTHLFSNLHVRLDIVLIDYMTNGELVPKCFKSRPISAALGKDFLEISVFAIMLQIH